MADTTEATIVHTVEVIRYDDPVIITERVAVSAFIAGYTDPTRRSYATDLRIFAAWCHDHGINLLNVKRPHLETFARWMEQEGRMASTIGRRLSTLSSFYKYCQIEDILDKNPALNVRRPKVHDESRTLGLDRNELGALLVQAGLGDSRDGALMTLLALNGLRISEALNADIGDLSTERGHRTLAIVRKGGKHVTIPIAPRTGRAIDLYIGERTMGPIFLGVEGGRMDRYCADRMVKRLVKRAGIDKRISPHSLRHSFITAALDAGVPLRDVQEAASPCRPSHDNALRPCTAQPRPPRHLHRVDLHCRGDASGLNRSRSTTRRSYPFVIHSRCGGVVRSRPVGRHRSVRDRPTSRPPVQTRPLRHRRHLRNLELRPALLPGQTTSALADGRRHRR